jgi:hypothetical protein
VVVRPAAEADIRETYDYLEEIRPGLGEQFATRSREVFERIESTPESVESSGTMFVRCECESFSMSFTTYCSRIAQRCWR